MRHASPVSLPVVSPRRYILRNTFTSHADAVQAAARVARRRHALAAIFNDASGFWRVRVVEAR